MCIPGMELDGVTDGFVEVASAPATSSPEAATATIAEMVVRVNDMWMTPRVVRTLTPRFDPRGGSVRSLVYGRAGGALGTGRGREHERRGGRKLGEAVERHPLAFERGLDRRPQRGPLRDDVREVEAPVALVVEADVAAAPAVGD